MMENIMIAFIYLGIILVAVVVAGLFLGILLVIDVVFKTHIGRKACRWFME